MKDVVASPVLPGPLDGDDVLRVSHHTDGGGIPLSTGTDGTKPLPFREVLADRTQGNGLLGGEDGLVLPFSNFGTIFVPFG